MKLTTGLDMKLPAVSKLELTPFEAGVAKSEDHIGRAII